MTVADVAALLKCKSSFIYNMTRGRGRSAIRPPHPGSAFALRVAVQQVICPCVAGLTGDSQSTMSAPIGLGKRSKNRVSRLPLRQATAGEAPWGFCG
jgi:hypothetical protein